MAIITPANLTFNGKEVRSFAEAVIESLYEYPALNTYMTVVGNVKAKQQIGLISHLHKITRLDPGCGQGQYTPNIPMSEKFWNPVDLKIWLNMCWKDFLGTFMVYYENAKTQKPDLTTTEIFSQWLIDEVDQAAKEDILRIAWFADTAITSGQLAAGVAVADYNQLNGIWKQLFAIAAANSSRRVTIAKNAGASKVAQQFDATDTTNQVATGIFQSLIFSADTRLRTRADGFILSTLSLVDQYYKERMAVTNIPMAYDRVENGIRVFKIMGVDVYAIDQWDRVIQGDLVNTTTYNLPHRAVYTVKANLQVGIDGPAGNEFTNWDVFYDKMSETSNIKGLYKMDAKVIEDYMVQLAY
jgi:hypothetical protein